MAPPLRLALAAALVALAAASVASTSASSSRRALLQFNAADALNQGQQAVSNTMGGGRDNNNNNRGQDKKENKDNKQQQGSPAPAPSASASNKAADGGDLPPAPPGKPSGNPPAIDKGPSGIIKDDGKGSDLIPSDAAASSDTRGAKSVAPSAIGIKTTGDAQKDESGKGLQTGVPVDVESAKSQSGARQASSVSFESNFNDAANNGLETPELRGVPAYSGGGTVNAPVQWLHAGIYTIPRYEANNFLSAITGFGASQILTVVLENWTAKLVGFGNTPIFRAPSVGFTYTWSRYEYLWYANTYGSWGWKTPPMALVMTDQFGNKMQVTVQCGINLKTFEVNSARVYDYRFYSGSNVWGK